MTRRRQVAVVPPPDLVELGELPPDPCPAWADQPLETRKPLPPPRFVEGWVVGGDDDLIDLLAELVEGSESADSALDLDRLLREMWWDRDEAERALLGTNPPAWATAPAGPELASELDLVRVNTAAPVTLIELMKAATRMQAWAEAVKAAAMAAFWSHREKEAAARAANDDPYYSTDAAKADPMSGAGAELAAALRLSPRTVGGQISDAVRLTSTFTETFAALRAGKITMVKAQALLDGTEHLTLANQRAVQQRVLRRAPDQTRAQLDAAVRRACSAVDPDGENKRHQRAKRNREISVRPLADGMAMLSWVDSADIIQTAWIALNCLADAAKRNRSGPAPATDPTQPATPTANGSPGSSATDPAAGGSTPRDPAPSGPAPSGPAPSDTAPSRPAPSGPAPSDTAPSRPAPSGTAPSGSAQAGSTPPSGPSDNASPGRTPPPDSPPNSPPDSPPDSAPEGSASESSAPGRRTADQRRCDAAADLFRVLLDRGTDWLERPFPAQHRRRPHIEVLVPITVLLGLRDDPCELAGHGPIPTDLARRLAAEGTWRRLLTDPFSGAVLEASTSRHDPPAQVSETLLARDQTCRWFGCRMPARRCDRDHATKFKQSRRTRLDDLVTLCESHHRIKDDDASGWRTVLHPDGTLDQTSPTGHRYQTRPPGMGPVAEPDPPPF